MKRAQWLARVISLSAVLALFIVMYMKLNVYKYRLFSPFLSR